MKTDAGDRDWVDDLVDLQLEQARGSNHPRWECPSPTCYSTWHGVPVGACKGSHTITKDTPVQQTP